MSIEPLNVKADSEAAIRRLGGKICDWLPVPDQTNPRTQEDLIGRALVMNALLQIYFGAPIHIIKGWIEEHGLSRHLSESERELLLKKNEPVGFVQRVVDLVARRKPGPNELSDQERTNLFWYIEALWTLLWAGGLAPNLDPTQGVPDTMAALCPNLQRNENGAKFSERMRLRPYDELYRMLDLYYRLHWWTRDGQLNGYGTHPVSLDVVMERRKALEWLLDSQSDWDHVEMST